MSLPIVFLDEARAEFDSAADWYNAQKRGLGTRFISHVEEAIDSIAANPRKHQKIFEDVRRAVVKKFPYTVLYQEQAHCILIVAVFHGRRDPSVWQSRLN
jgi:plasmid stabilization system protein ParE